MLASCCITTPSPRIVAVSAADIGDPPPPAHLDAVHMYRGGVDVVRRPRKVQPTARGRHYHPVRTMTTSAKKSNKIGGVLKHHKGLVNINIRPNRATATSTYVYTRAPQRSTGHTSGYGAGGRHGWGVLAIVTNCDGRAEKISDVVRMLTLIIYV